MQALRNSVPLARLVMAWFALTLGLAIASPLVHPQAMGLVCTAGGSVRLVVVNGEEGQAVSAQHSLDCPLCLAVTPPPAHVHPSWAQLQPMGRALQPIVSARIASLVGAPLPPRGPPLLLLIA